MSLRIGFNFQDVKDLTNDKNHKLYPVYLVIKRWIETLGLNQNFKIVFDNPNEPQMKGDGEVRWNGETWEVRCKRVEKYAIIHEIGHVYLNKLLNKIEFVKSISSLVTFRTNVELEIRSIVGVLNDCFLEYQLSKIKEFYDILTSYWKNEWPPSSSNPNGSLRQQKVKIADKTILISMYFVLFLHSRYLFRDKDRSRLKDISEDYLKTLRALIIENYNDKKVIFNSARFEKLDLKLNGFAKVKDLGSVEERNNLKFYYYEVIKALGLFNANIIKKVLFEKSGFKLN